MTPPTSPGPRRARRTTGLLTNRTTNPARPVPELLWRHVCNLPGTNEATAGTIALRSCCRCRWLPPSSQTARKGSTPMTLTLLFRVRRRSCRRAPPAARFTPGRFRHVCAPALNPRAACNPNRLQRRRTTQTLSEQPPARIGCREAIWVAPGMRGNRATYSPLPSPRAPPRTTTIAGLGGLRPSPRLPPGSGPERRHRGRIRPRKVFRPCPAQGACGLCRPPPRPAAAIRPPGV